MIQYLFDTDILSYLMRRQFATLQARFIQTPPAQCAISAITCAEILFGLESQAPGHANRLRALAFLESISILDWPADATPHYARIRYTTRHQPLHERDTMIAAHAIALGATLVTNNTKHFARIGNGLKFENWLW